MVILDLSPVVEAFVWEVGVGLNGVRGPRFP